MWVLFERWPIVSVILLPYMGGQGVVLVRGP